MAKTELIYRNEMFGTEYSSKNSWDINIHEVADMVYGLLRSAGYHHNSIAKVLDCEETYEERERQILSGELDA